MERIASPNRSGGDGRRDERAGAHPLSAAVTIPRMSTRRDRELGMDRPITRRDFIGGVAVGLGGATWLAGCGPGEPAGAARSGRPDGGRLLSARPDRPARRPRGLVRSRPTGCASGAFPLDGAIDRRETYDLIVVGGGISGLSAAHYFRQQAGPAAKVLVLDNHDDFGGHAKRNEFTHDGRTWIGYGGTQSIDSPAPYSATAKALIADLGIDVSPLRAGARRQRSIRRSACRAAPSSTRRPSAPTGSSSAPRATRRRSSWRSRRCRRRCSSRS